MANLSSTREYINRLSARLEKSKEKGEAAIGQAMQLAEVGGMSFLAGYANAKYGVNGEYTIKGVPGDLLAGLAMHAAAFSGLAGKHADHVHNLADGAIAGYSYRMGAHIAATA